MIVLPDNYESIHGWCTREKAYKMSEYINDNTSLCVELGVWGGRSLLPIALAAPRNATIIGVDAWCSQASLEGTNTKINDDWWANLDYDHMFDYAKNLMIENGVPNVQLWRNKSLSVVTKFNDESIDFLHQDSNHSEEVSCGEVEAYYNKVKRRGIWVFDDTNWESTKKAQGLLVSKGYEELYDSGEWKIYQRI